MKYIDADRLIEQLKHYLDIQPATDGLPGKYSYEARGVKQAIDYALSLIKDFQQELPNGKQVIIITETDNDANIYWDCRSLEDVRALLACAESYISDKQNAELRGKGSGPDYNTTDGRFRNAHKSQRGADGNAILCRRGEK